MGEIKNSSILIQIENLKNEEKRSKSEVIDLFKKIFIALDAHTPTPSVNKGLDDLAVEVCELELQLSNVTQERDNLLQSVNNLKAELRQFGSSFIPTLQPQSVPVNMLEQTVTQSCDIQEVKPFEIGEDQQEVHNSTLVSYHEDMPGFEEAGEPDVGDIGEKPKTRILMPHFKRLLPKTEDTTQEPIGKTENQKGGHLTNSKCPTAAKTRRKDSHGAKRRLERISKSEKKQLMDLVL